MLNRGATGQRGGEAGGLEAQDGHQDHQHAVARGFSEDVEGCAEEAASIGIIGGADGPTSIYLTAILAPHLLGAVAVAAYSYMALVPVIQPPIMRLLTTDAERAINMPQARPVSQTAVIIFPIFITVLTALAIPSSAPLIGMLMFGNLLRESGATDRLSKTAGGALINIVTIFLGLVVGSTMLILTGIAHQSVRSRRYNNMRADDEAQAAAAARGETPWN